jgi:protein O-mannosyl-transferase
MTRPRAAQAQHRGSLRHRVLALLLVLMTVAAYLPVWQCAFVVYDDPDYVTNNQMVRAGLTGAGMKWAFTTTHAYNWHPLTWLSHMTDCQLFGLQPGAHHLVNVLFHAVNAALLFLLLLRVTAAMWPAAFVAAMFALHPLHVESVAWVSERKDVLSTFFGLLALAAYARFVGGDKWRVTRTKSGRASIVTHVTRHVSQPYVLALLFFALGLMAKPMLVTLPFVLVLLDWWPLQRVSRLKGQMSGSGAQHATRNSEHVRLLFEKWPFFVLTVLSCLVTFLAQRGKPVISLEQLPFGLRLANAFRSYALYLLKAIWPADLSVIYPFPHHIPAWQLAGAGALLGAISWFAWRLRRRCPYLFVGWLWYLGMLVPVIGLVQVGGQPMADRYTYLPLVGILIAVAFGAHDLAKRFPNGNKLAGIAATVLLMACLFATERQLRCWHDSVALFSHAVGVTENNVIAENNLAWLLATSPEPSLRNGPRAVNLALDAARLTNYNDPGILDTLAVALAETGHFAEAIKVAEEAIQLATVHTNAVLADAVRLRLEGYRVGKPFHEGVLAGK